MSSSKDEGGGEKQKEHSLHAALKVVKDANSSDDYWAGVESLEKMLLNVKNNPLEEKYRKLPIDEPWYAGKVGCLDGHEELMEAAGFYPQTDPDDGKEYYMMEASAEAWEELLLVGTILHKTIQKKKRKSVSRSSSKKSLKSSSLHNSSDKDMDAGPDFEGAEGGKSSSRHSRSSSRHSRSKKSKQKSSRRISNESSFNDSGSARSLFEDEGGGQELVVYESDANRSGSKRKSKKKKSKKSSDESGDKKKKKSSKKHDGSSSDEDGSVKRGASMGESGESLTLDSPLGSPSGKKSIDPSKQSPVKGVTQAKYKWAMATSAVIEANRTKEMTVEIDSDGEEGEDNNIKKAEKQAGEDGDDNNEALSLLSPKVSSTAKKDYWKNAATQALLLAKMKDPESADDADDGGKDGGGAPPIMSPVQARGKWKGALAQIKALETVSAKTENTETAKAAAAEKEPGKVKSRRGLWSRSGSSRSAGSASSEEFDDEDENGRRKGLKRSGSRRGSRKKLTAGESKQRIEALERGLSKHEIEEHRKMLKEQEEIRAMQRTRLLNKIRREPGPRCTAMVSLVSMLTAAELSLNLVTTCISFISLVGSFECCGNAIDASTLTLGITVPYVALIAVEMFMLICTVMQARHNSAWDKERIERFDEGGPLDDLEWFDDDESYDSEEEWELEKSRFRFNEIMKYILIANPFLGCLITWVLLYETSKTESFLIFALEGGSIVLMFITVFVEREGLTCCSLLIHAIPLIPFSATCFVVWYYLSKGGICFRDNNFWFDNCGLCDDGRPLPEDMVACPNGELPHQGTYCGEILVEQFCYYAY